MFMQRIRKATKKNRGVLIVVVALLTVGLIGSFAVWNSGDYANANKSGGGTVEEQISSYQDYLAGIQADSTAGADYEKVNTLASGYQYLYQLYAQAQAETTDAAKLSSYQVAAQVAAAKAAQFYQQSLSLAPETLNEVGRARILANQGYASYLAGDSKGADAAYTAAIALAPTDLELANNYASILFDSQGLEATINYLNSYIAGLPMGSANIEQAKGLISKYQKIAEMLPPAVSQ
ncbi:MAG: hypothetical protein RR387_02100 [Clostridiales bacterium]